MTNAADSVGIKLVVFDWAGTLIDHGSLAPVHAMVTVFGEAGITVSAAHVRSSMGTGKREHIETILRIPEILRRFRVLHRRTPNESDVNALYATYMPAQLEAIRRRAGLIDGAITSIAYLREHHVAVATSTGYFRDAANLVLAYAAQRGLVPDHAVCDDDVPAGRPAPFMIYDCMRALNVQRPRQVLVVGDTALDVIAARNGGCMSVGVAGSGNEVGLDETEWNALELRERNARLANAHRNLRDAGADFVIDTLCDLPLVIQRIAERGLSSAA
jgi:phosphonoacetaldehyde hydrolase